MAVLLAGLPVTVPASTVNRLCGSSLDADHRRRPAGRARRGRRRRGRRRRVDVARALGAAQARAAVPGRQRRAGLDDPRLAAGQPRDARRLDRLARRGDRAAARAGGHHPRGPGRVRAAVPPARGRRPGTAASTTTWSSRVPGVDLARDESIRADTTAEKLAGAQAVVPRRTAPSPRATPRRSTTAPRRRCSASAAAGRARPATRSRAIAGWGAAANEPQFFGFAPVEAAERALTPRRHRLGRRRRRRAQRGVRRPVARLHRRLGRSTRRSSTPTAGPSRSATRWAPPAPGSSAPSPATLGRPGERWGVAAICIGVGQGLAVVLENVTDGRCA